VSQPLAPAQSKHRTAGNAMTGPTAAEIYRTTHPDTRGGKSFALAVAGLCPLHNQGPPAFDVDPARCG